MPKKHSIKNGITEIPQSEIDARQAVKANRLAEEALEEIDTKLTQDLSAISHTDADGNEFTFTETLQNRFMHKITLNRTFNWPSNTGIVSLTIPKARAIAEAVDDIMDALLIQSITDKGAL